jgi:hypothetical protein
MFKKNEINQILRHFPKFELSYEMITHNKVYGSNAILAIPEGKKCFAWFTIYKNNKTCFLLEVDENKNITNLEIINACFKDKLTLGTIFYGTSFFIKNNNFIQHINIIIIKLLMIYQ